MIYSLLTAFVALTVVKLMSESPPSYSEVERDAAAAVGQVQQSGHSEGRQDAEYRHTGRSRGRMDWEYHDAARPEDRQNNPIDQAVGSEGIHNATGGDNVIDNNVIDNNNPGKRNTSNSFSGFIDVLHEKKKLPWNCGINLIYKFGLLVYFFANLVYAIVAAALQREEVVYYTIYGCISFIGCVFEIIIVTVYIRKLCVQANIDERQFNLPQEADYPRKAQRVIVDYVLLSLGEFLIHPVLICTVYGFVNETAWEFGSAIAVCNLYSFHTA